MSRKFFFLSILFLSSPAVADEYFRCNSMNGESRVVKHVDLLPGKNWTCESFTLTAIKGEEEPEDLDEELAEELDEAPNAPPSEEPGNPTLPAVNTDPEGETITMEQILKNVKEAGKDGEVAFEDEKEMEHLVEACRGGSPGYECGDMLRNIMRRIPIKKKK